MDRIVLEEEFAHRVFVRATQRGYVDNVSAYGVSAVFQGAKQTFAIDKFALIARMDHEPQQIPSATGEGHEYVADSPVLVTGQR